MKFTFADLFAGIGGFHLALEEAGGECVFASEWDSNARLTYELNFSKSSPTLFTSGNFMGDITQVDKSAIPDFDVLAAGFPCQPFSQAGRKKGFQDTRGTLFFDIAEILSQKRPKAFFLENVRHLISHDEGNTIKTIERVLTEDLGYSYQQFTVKASDHGLPQHRPRVFMIGFRDGTSMIDKPEPRELQFTMSDVFEGHVDKKIGYTLRVGGKASGINDRRNWDSYLVDDEVKRLTREEGKRMQGFPDDFEFPVSESEAMKQLGNSVAVWAVRDYAIAIAKVLDSGKV